ncbi:LmbE-like protein [Ganoderma leucocontextum]|nr:LmbE-like protein [Ganoderma leucocontextum]
MLHCAPYWLAILVLSCVWGFLARPAQQDIQLLLNPNGTSNILLLTAHPDDECMFFAPTILALQAITSPQIPALHSLCLSIGDADGLGDIRRRELSRSLDVLDIGEGRRWVVDIPELHDDLAVEWDPQVIANTLRPYVLENKIDTILTFDHDGISSHPNHISLPKGVAHLLNALASTPEKPHPRLFMLVTVSLHEKYLGVLSPLLKKASIALVRSPCGTRTSQDGGCTRRVVAVSGSEGYALAHRAMREHWSQLVWFRWLYVSFSRYMWVNEWVEVVLPSDANSDVQQ